MCGIYLFRDALLLKLLQLLLCGLSTTGAVLQTYPRKLMIDIGCFIVRTALAKQVGFRDKTHNGDGTYVEDIVSRFGQTMRIGKLNKVLFVHN